MKTVIGFASVVMLAWIAQPASAQPPFVPGGQAANPASRPMVSPYLNLLRGSGTAGTNLYDLVRPQLQNQAAIAGLQSQANSPAYSQYSIDPNGIPYTGQRTGYMTHFSYFMNNGSNSGGLGRQGMSSSMGMGNRAAMGMGGTNMNMNMGMGVGALNANYSNLGANYRNAYRR